MKVDGRYEVVKQVVITSKAAYATQVSYSGGTSNRGDE